MIPQSNIKDLMLRKDVVAAVKEGRFSIYAVRNIDEGIEILTGRKAGEMQADGSYSEGTINFLVDQKLKELAEGIKEFVSTRESKGQSANAKSC
jgi:predicted ATP-dependent protease